MSLNLHGLVRGAIGAVNSDIVAQWLVSTGYTQDASYAQVPSYADPVDVLIQVQPMSSGDLQHPDMLNVQGVKRAVYMYGNAQGVVRIDAKGGDLLQFPQVQGGPVYTWLVCAGLETWTPDATGWCKVGVVLQNEPPT